MKKALAVLIVFLAIIVAFGSQASAADTVASGSCGTEGSDLSWTLDSDGVLTISGEGAIADYALGTIPWVDHRADITSVYVGDGVTAIGTYAFARCSNIETLRLPKSLTAVGQYAFYGCSKLAIVDYYGSEITADEIVISDYNTALTEAGWNYLWIPEILETGDCGEGNTTVAYTIYEDGLLVIAGEGTIRDYYRFGGHAWEPTAPWYRKAIKKVIIEQGITGIGNYTFCECYYLKSVSVPASVERIGESAFNYCSCLESITIPDGVTKIEDATFFYCDSLRSITLPDSVTSIGNSAFLRCSSLTSITIPDEVTIIGDNAFEQCEELTNITLPDSITSIGSSAFSECEKIKSITIPKSLKSLGAYAFNQCKSLASSITIPEGVERIGENTFYGCGCIPEIGLPDGLSSIGDWAFAFCGGLISIRIPDSVTSIGEQAFRECRGLISIIIPDDVSRLGSAAFLSCENLESVILPDGITEIESSTFAYCEKLTDIVIPGGVTSIGRSAFYDCGGAQGMKTVFIPDSVTSIEMDAFYWQHIHYMNSYDVYYSGSKEQWNSIAFPGGDFLGTTGLGVFHYNYIYPCVSGTYDGTIDWTRYSDGSLIISGNGSLPGDSASTPVPWAKRIGKVTSLVIEDDISEIGEFAFSGYENLNVVSLGASVETIGEGAFFACSSLSILQLANSVRSIDNDAFGACDQLSEICYLGTETEWAATDIGAGNEVLSVADKHIGNDWAFIRFDWSMLASGRVNAEFRCDKCGRIGTLSSPVTQSGDTLSVIVNGPDGMVYTDILPSPTYSATVTMNENFNLNLYVKGITEEYASLFTVKWTFDGESFEKNLGKLIPQIGGQYPGSYKVMLANVFSYQMTKPFNIVVYRKGNDTPIKEINYSVQQYFENQYNKTSDTMFKKIYGAALDYGAAAQLYFNGMANPATGEPYDTDVSNLANKTTNPSFTINATKPTNKAAKSGSINGMDDKMTATLIFGSETSIKIYFKYSGDINDMTITSDNGKTVTAPELGSDGRYSVKIEGIRSFELYKDFTFTFSAWSEARTVTYSAYAYAANKWNSDDTSLSRLVKALVAYGELARQKWQ